MKLLRSTSALRAPVDNLRMACQPYSRDVRKRERRLVTRIFASWNQLDCWLRQVEGLRTVA
jgi:hypothetical protein